MPEKRRAVLEGGPCAGRVVEPFKYVGQTLVTPEGERYEMVAIEGNTGDDWDTYIYRYVEANLDEGNTEDA